MKSMQWLAVFLLVLASVGFALGQAKSEERRTVSQIEDRLVSNVEGEFVPAADAMPEDKYSFAPTNGEFKGVRTFAQQVKHRSGSELYGRRGHPGRKASGGIDWRKRSGFYSEQG